jgi:hypothetical protein
MPLPLLQLAYEVFPQSSSPPALFGWETARALGGAVLSLTPCAAPPKEWRGLRVLTSLAGESVHAALLRALDLVQPGVVLVQHLGAVNPALLLTLRERGIPYAVFLHDFTPLCPTHRLWHRRQDPAAAPAAPASSAPGVSAGPGRAPPSCRCACCCTAIAPATGAPPWCAPTP